MSARARPRLAAAIAALACLAAAADPAERLADPVREATARRIFQETRCLVCQGQSIDESDAPLAGDLRRIIRRQVAAGRTPAEVRRFLLARYGEFVLFRPPFNAWNAGLWLAPFGALFAGVALLGARTRRRLADAAPLTSEEAERLDRLRQDE
ncbi:MAG: cytochrome c-type biogenesis protein CcmH [Caulobacteraceae bacterium]|nr:cytochrome c-type biogenesis protein CcmH [Caulobacteraceae bacterium]